MRAYELLRKIEQYSGPSEDGDWPLWVRREVREALRSHLKNAISRARR